MKTQTLGAGTLAHPVEGAAVPSGHNVVAVVVQWRSKIALFKRSQSLRHESGQWHCITGYMEPGRTPRQQAMDELREEAGLEASHISELRSGPKLLMTDGSGALWLVHTFTAVTSNRRLEIDWEHEAYRWTPPSKVKRFSNRVYWLDQVLEATGFHDQVSAGISRPAAPSGLLSA
ncbi:NUDIX domain-containing protein [Arthrobacter sp. efr-133-TYG-104]|uniref:NUDIX domain-containing protein n=1 Tax=Arthrobacter sp. efr-133-TYG-104 TaxID=3040324 RepID=UPI00254E4A65|nr:NUDIX domain-containing protein [Arthrobacter sp. efr-133-TYG-104]